MQRREVLGLLGALPFGWPVTARAQGPKVLRLGSLSGGSIAGTKERDTCFQDALRQLGWTEGQNILIERRWASGNTTRLPALAAELVALKPDLVMTSGTPAAQAMQRATHDIPMVFNMVSDPVASGIVASLARPAANITGVSNFFPAMIGKLLELIETVSGAKRFAVLHDPSNPGKQLDIRFLQESGRPAGLEFEPVPLHNANDIDPAFQAMAKTPPGALIVLVDAITLSNRQSIVEGIARLKLPAIYQERAFVELGGLMSYALNYCAHFARAAAYVDRILRGERPSNLPVEQPATFELVINLKTAKAQGVNVPPTMLALADRVIE
jgi:putative ABC transport system substrate-binding protein